MAGAFSDIFLKLPERAADIGCDCIGADESAQRTWCRPRDSCPLWWIPPVTSFHPRKNGWICSCLPSYSIVGGSGDGGVRADWTDADSKRMTACGCGVCSLDAENRARGRTYRRAGTGGRWRTWRVHPVGLSAR